MPNLTVRPIPLLSSCGYPSSWFLRPIFRKPPSSSWPLQFGQCRFHLAVNNLHRHVNSGTVIVQCIALIRVIHRRLLLTKLRGITSLQVIKMLFDTSLSSIGVNSHQSYRYFPQYHQQPSSDLPGRVVLGVNFLRLTDLINEGTDILKSFAISALASDKAAKVSACLSSLVLVQISYRFFYFIYRAVQYRLLFKQVLCKRPVNLRSHRKSIRSSFTDLISAVI